MGERDFHALQKATDSKRTQSLVLFTAKIQVPFHATKKNKYRIGNRRLFKDQRTLWYEEIVLLSLRKRALDIRLNEPIGDLVWAVFTYHFPESVYFTKKRSMSGRLPDLSNLHEAVQDCLQKAGIIRNDRNICSHDGSRRVVGDEFLLEVMLLRHEPDERR